VSLKRTQLGYLQSLLLPITAAKDNTGPRCLTCLEVVDLESMVEGYPGQTTFCRVLVRHHGAEELRTFEFDSVEWDHRDLKRAMQSARFFDPLGHGEGTASVQVPGRLAAS